MKRLICLLFLALILNPIFAQTYYEWDSSFEGSWNDASNWVPPGVPGVGDSVLIPFGSTIFIDNQVELAWFYMVSCELEFTNPAAGLKITGSGGWENGPIRTTLGSIPADLEIADSATFSINDGNLSTIHLRNGVRLINNGTLVVNTGVGIHDSTYIENYGVMELRDGAKIVYGSLFSTPTGILNYGTIRKTDSTGIGQIGGSETVPFFQNLGGRIEVLEGELIISCTHFLQGGIYETAPGTKLNFSGGFEQYLEGELTGMQQGTLIYNGTRIIPSPEATLNFDGTGVTFSLAQLRDNGTLTIAENTSSRLVLGTTLRDNSRLLNRGNVVEMESIAIYDSSTFENHGTVNLDKAVRISWGGGLRPQVQNYGTFYKSNATLPLFTCWVPFTNASGGILDIAEGTIRIGAGQTPFLNEEGAILRGKGSFHSPLLPDYFDNGITAPGPGTATLTFDDLYAPLESAELQIELGGTAAGTYDALDVAKFAYLNGSLRMSLANGYVPVSGDSFTVITAGFGVQDSFHTVALPSGVFASAIYHSNEVVVKIDSVGMVGINDEQQLLTESFILYQNYPNPFNPSTTIRYDLREAGFIELEIFDVQGRKIKTLFSGVSMQGSHRVVWNGRNDTGEAVSSGIYLLRLKAVNEILHRRMVLLK